MGYPWFFVFVSLVAKKMVLGPNVIFVLLASYVLGVAGWFSYVLSMSFKLAWLALFSPLLK